MSIGPGRRKTCCFLKSLRISPDRTSLRHAHMSCDPTECRQPGSSIHGISQARILEQVAISSSGDLPNPGIEPASPVSPALSGRFFTTALPNQTLQPGEQDVCVWPGLGHTESWFLKENVCVLLPKDRGVKTADTYYNFQCLSSSEILFAIGAICREEA